MGRGPYRIGRNAEGHRLPTPQIDHVHRPGHGHRDMDVVVEIGGTQSEDARIAVPAIAHDGFEECSLKGTAQIVNAETQRRVLTRIRKSARREPKTERVGEPVQKNVVPDAAWGKLDKL